MRVTSGRRSLLDIRSGLMGFVLRGVALSMPTSWHPRSFIRDLLTLERVNSFPNGLTDFGGTVPPFRFRGLEGR